MIVQGGLIGRWSKQKGDRWLVIRSVYISHRLDRHVADAERAGAVVQPSQRAEKFGGTERDADHNAKHQSIFAQ